MKNIYLDLYITFAKIGSLTFGGGIAMLPMMQNELIDKKQWVSENEILDYYAIGQSTPGIIAVNVATFVGYKKAGILGGIIATLGVITPCVVLITILANLIDSIDHYPNVQKALKGINVAVCALITDATLNFAKKTSKGAVSILLMLLSFCLIFFFNIKSYIIILGSAFIAVAVYFIEKKFKKNDEKKSLESKADSND
ncbi:MAG: chromate transporter [Treponema sp.]|jgi:chromate transporter|nr:chromate transporter [Treponema sp.]